MISWLLVAISAYLLFGLASLGDKLFLAGQAEPKSYTFYVGILSAVIVLLIPFIKFGIPDAAQMFWSILAGIVYAGGLYASYEAIEKFEVSKVMATLGATQPIFILALTWIFWSSYAIRGTDILALVLLFLGSIIISFEKTPEITGEYLKITLLASFLFSLDYILSKIVFLGQPFLQGLIWIRIFTFVTVLFFLFSKDARKKIFKKQNMPDAKTKAIFVGTQVSGGIGNILQSFSIALAPIAVLPIINSLRGVQYAFLFIATLFLSFFFPKVLKEATSKKIIIQKIISMILIVAGLAIVVIY